MKSKHIKLGIAVIAIFLTVSCGKGTKTTLSQVTTPAEAIQVLKEGNQRFCSGHTLFPNHDIERVTETASHQHPFAIVVGCSDSRVPVEVLFDRGIGDLFVVRTAANTAVDPSTMGSIEYAALHLHTKLIVVLGHSACGGITSALNTETEEVEELECLLNTVREGISEYVGDANKCNDAILANIKIQEAHILDQPELKALVDKGELLVVGAYYDLHTGQVTFL